MLTVDVTDARWRKSSRSSGDGVETSCVEVAFVDQATAVRDSKNPGPALVFPVDTWRTFLTNAD